MLGRGPGILFALFQGVLQISSVQLSGNSDVAGHDQEFKKDFCWVGLSPFARQGT